MSKTIWTHVVIDDDYQFIHVFKTPYPVPPSVVKSFHEGERDKLKETLLKARYTARVNSINHTLN